MKLKSIWTIIFQFLKRTQKTELKIIGNEINLDGSLLIYLEGKYKKHKIYQYK